MPSTKPLSINRRTLLAGAAATTALAATSSAAQDTIVSAKPDMAGKSVLITGCSSGFGRLGAEHYARLGAKVFATMRGLPRPEADELKALAKRDGLDIHVLEIDVTDDAQVTAGIAEAERINGGALDILVNNAGVGITGPVEVQDMEATKLAFDTNVLGYHRLVRAVLPGMRAKKSGQIFLISSQLGRVIVPGGGHYSATKFAVEAMGEQLAYELVPHNIEVTIIQPGGYPTDVWKNRNAIQHRFENPRRKISIRAAIQRWSPGWAPRMVPAAAPIRWMCRTPLREIACDAAGHPPTSPRGPSGR